MCASRLSPSVLEYTQLLQALADEPATTTSRNQQHPVAACRLLSFWMQAKQAEDKTHSMLQCCGCFGCASLVLTANAGSRFLFVGKRLVHKP